MKETAYTLIIPHYNLTELLRRLLKTIPLRDDMQIIVVDDCSKDQILLDKVKAEFPYVEFYSTPSNGGAGMARNIGLNHAIGKYLIFADADDYFNICFDRLLDKYKNTNFDIIYFAANSVDSTSYQTSHRDNSITPLVNKFLKSGYDYDLKFKFTAPWCKFISRDIVEANKIRFQESPVYNDMRFSQLVDFHAESITADSIAAYCVTDRASSVSSVTIPEKEIVKMEVASAYCHFARQNGLPSYPIWSYLGPSYDAITANGWKEYKNAIYKPWIDTGISIACIRFSICKYKVITKAITPLRQAIHSLRPNKTTRS